MSDLRKWMKIIESVPAIFPEQPVTLEIIKKDATVMVHPRVGGGTGRFMHSTPNGAMIDIKGVSRELSNDDFSTPERDYEDPYQKGNDWFHMNRHPDTIGTLNDKPEFRAGDIVKVADVYGAVIGPGIGVFAGYSTNGKEAVISFDGKEIIVPVANLASALEQNAKDNFSQMDNDGNLSPMSLGSDNVKIETPAIGVIVQEPEMDHRDEFSKWMSAVEEALFNNSKKELAEDTPTQCGCGNWDCAMCFPNVDANLESPELMPNGEQDDPIMSFGANPSFGVTPQDESDVCPMCGHQHDENSEHQGDIYSIPDNEQEFEIELEDGSCGGMSAGGVASAPTEMDEEESEFIEKPKSGKGVKLGDIITKTEFRKSGSGQESPLTYGDENLEEDPGTQSYSDDEDAEYRSNMINSVNSMQNMGLSKSNQHYDVNELAMLPIEDLKACYSRVMGDVSETRHQINDIAEDEEAVKYEVYDRRTGEKVSGPYSSRTRARSVRDKKDNEYGGYRYDVRPVKIVAHNQMHSRTPDQHLSNVNTPELHESLSIVMCRPTLMEQLKWDDELVEAFIEESSLSKLIGQEKGGQKLVNWLHKKHKLSNTADLKPAPFNQRLLWKEYKRNPDNFVIVAGSDGVAGIKPYEKYIKDRIAAFAKKGKVYDPGGDSTLPYQIVAFTDDGQQIDPALLKPQTSGEEEKYSDPTVMKARMGLHHGKDTQNSDNVFNLLADQIGRLQTVFITGGEESGKFSGQGIEREKIKNRNDMKSGSTMSEHDALQKILSRVTPVINTIANQTLSHINKTAQKYITNDDFESAEKISTNGQKLKSFISKLDSNNGESAEGLLNIIKRATIAASGTDGKSDEYLQWLNDAAKGNSVALKPVIDSLRNALSAI